MSAGDGPGDDDRLDDLIDELSDLTDLLRMAFSQGPGELEDKSEPEGPNDMWDEGTSMSVRTVSEFKEWRSKAASSDEVSTPYFATDELEGYDSVVDAHIELYKQGYQNLEELRSTLGVDGFQNFVVEFAKQADDPDLAGSGLIVGELVDILDPSPSFFGIQEIEGETKINTALTPFSFTTAYGYTWHITAEPSLRLGMESTEDVSIMIGGMTGKEINKKMAKVIDRTGGLKLPERYEGLL